MAVDMKETIARETLKLIFVKQVKKLTVKDIVESCGITRQAFYYHFADIPDLIQWIMEQNRDRLMQDFLETADLEERIHRFLLYALNVRPVLKRGLESNFSRELETLLWENMQLLFRRAMEQEGLMQGLDSNTQELHMRYHYQAIKGMLMQWTDTDTQNLDQITHMIFQILSRERTT